MFLIFILSFYCFNAESGPVLKLTVSPLDDSSVTISWMPPNIPNGVITSYNVMIFKLEGNTGILIMNTTSGSQTTFMGSNLGMC